MKLSLSVPVDEEFEAEAARLIDAGLASRLSAKDAELFDGAADAADRMGWVDLPQNAADLLDKIESLRLRLQEQGLRTISLAGMG